MIEKRFDSKFHKFYVGEIEGDVEEKPVVQILKTEVRSQTFADILAEYRAYVKDPKAELPAPVLEEMRQLGKI